MIKVFALQPEAITDISLIQRLEQFGFDQGRILGKVPKSWMKFVTQAIQDTDPRHRKRLVVQLERLLKDRAIQPLPADSVDASWILAATSVSEEYLHGIIVNERNDASDARVLGLGDHIGDSKIWKVATNTLSSRDVKSMASQVAVLMRYACDVKFVDPYFTGEKRHLDFVSHCVSHRNTSPLKAKINIEFHFLWRRRQPGDDYATLRLKSKFCFNATVQSTQRSLSGSLRPNDRITWCQWTEKEDQDHQRFHERYVLTDLGGVEFGGGLDTVNSSQQTSVNLLSKTTVNTLNSRFRKDGKEFELLHSEEVRM
jgi:hypothetical protein